VHAVQQNRQLCSLPGSRGSVNICNTADMCTSVRFTPQPNARKKDTQSCPADSSSHETIVAVVPYIASKQDDVLNGSWTFVTNQAPKTSTYPR
jgi:hypothetical protein